MEKEAESMVFPPHRGTDDTESAMKPQICPICGKPVDDEVVKCVACGTLHHPVCAGVEAGRDRWPCSVCYAAAKKKKERQAVLKAQQVAAIALKKGASIKSTKSAETLASVGSGGIMSPPASQGGGHPSPSVTAGPSALLTDDSTTKPNPIKSIEVQKTDLVLVPSDTQPINLTIPHKTSSIRRTSTVSTWERRAFELQLLREEEEMIKKQQDEALAL